MFLLIKTYMAVILQENKQNPVMAHTYQLNF